MAIGAAIIAALKMGIEAMELVLVLLEMLAVGVMIVKIMLNKNGDGWEIEEG